MNVFEDCEFTYYNAEIESAIILELLDTCDDCKENDPMQECIDRDALHNPDLWRIEENAGDSTNAEMFDDVLLREILEVGDDFGYGDGEAIDEQTITSKCNADRPTLDTPSIFHEIQSQECSPNKKTMAQFQRNPDSPCGVMEVENIECDTFNDNHIRFKIKIEKGPIQSDFSISKCVFEIVKEQENDSVVAVILASELEGGGAEHTRVDDCSLISVPTKEVFCANETADYQEVFQRLQRELMLKITPKKTWLKTIFVLLKSNLFLPWSPCGTQFFVCNDILQRFEIFKAKKLKALKRRLNEYGFRCAPRNNVNTESRKRGAWYTCAGLHKDLIWSDFCSICHRKRSSSSSSKKKKTSFSEMLNSDEYSFGMREAPTEIIPNIEMHI